MSEYALQTVFISPEQAKAAMRAQVAPFCHSLWNRGVQRISVMVQPEEDARSTQQNAYYWGVVLKEISAQATIGGVGATPDGWHLYFKKKHLGYKFTKVREPGKKRATVRKELRSTTDLSVRKMSEYLEQVMAEAVTDFGVRFSVSKWEEYRP